MSTRQGMRDAAFRIARRTTRDALVPLWEGDDFLNGRRNIPVPPGDPFVEEWEVFDDSKDYHTVWFRRCTDHVATACLGPAPDGKP
jgi:hypothetical protein